MKKEKRLFDSVNATSLQTASLEVDKIISAFCKMKP